MPISLVINETPSVGTSAYTVTRSINDISVNDSTTKLLPGEVLSIRIDGNGGITVDDIDLDLCIVTDWDDDGRTFDISVMGTNVASTSWGRVVNHSWDTPGTYNCIISTYTVATGLYEESFTVVVGDPDNTGDVVWDERVYVDLNGNTTGFPAETSNVTHITSSAEWLAWTQSTSTGDNVWVQFRGGVSHTVAPASASSVRQRGDIIYFTPFGSGKVTVIAGGSFVDHKFFETLGAGQRVIVTDYIFDGQYSMMTGLFSGCAFKPAIYDSQASCHVSISNCQFIGCYQWFYNVQTTGAVGFWNCNSNEKGWKDYAVLLTGKWFVASGCEFRADPLYTPYNDDKNFADPNAPDHSAIRCGQTAIFGLFRCLGACSHGWSSLGNGTDSQPMVRIHHQDTHGIQTDYLVSFQHVHHIGSRMMVNGGPSSPTLNTPIGRTIIEHCFHEGDALAGAQAGLMVNSRWGGIKAQNCVGVVSGLQGHATRSNFSLVAFTEDQAGVGTVAKEINSLIRYCTLWSEANASGFSIAAVTTSGAVWSGFVAENNNLVAGDNHSNTVLAQSSMSPGDYFRPVTGSAADDTASGNKPYFDFRHNAVRASTTNKGAHHSASTFLAAPTIAYNSGLVLGYVSALDVYRVTDLGDWDNLNPWLVDYEFLVDAGQINAAALSDRRKYYEPDAADIPGDLTCVVRATDYSGTLKNTTSNAVTL